jgi:hypothetical protein
MTRTLVLLAAASAATGVLLAGGVASTSASPSSTACGTVTVKGGGRTYVYSVRRYAGRTTCLRARRVMRTYLAAGTYPRGWLCVRGHASQGQRWAAACSNASGALLRAFGPLRRQRR